MNYQIRITMNRKPVLEGMASTVMAYENIRHIVETYQPEDKGVLPIMESRMLDRMMSADVGEVFSAEWLAIRDNYMSFEAEKVNG